MKPDIFLNNSRNYIVEVQSQKIRSRKSKVMKENCSRFRDAIQYLAFPEDVGEKKVLEMIKQSNLEQYVEKILLYPTTIGPFLEGIPAVNVVREVSPSKDNDFAALDMHTLLTD